MTLLFLQAKVILIMNGTRLREIRQNIFLIYETNTEETDKENLDSKVLKLLIIFEFYFHNSTDAIVTLENCKGPFLFLPSPGPEKLLVGPRVDSDCYLSGCGQALENFHDCLLS